VFPVRDPELAVALGAAIHGASVNSASSIAPPEPATHQRYRDAVEMAFADQRLDTSEFERLCRLQCELELSESEAARIEKMVMGETKEALVQGGMKWVEDVILEQLEVLLASSSRERKPEQHSSPVTLPSMEAGILRVLRSFQPQLDLFVHPEIPARKLNNARESCAIPPGEKVLGLIDCTIFGSAKDCVVFGGSFLYYYHMNATPKHGNVSYRKFPGCEFKKKGSVMVTLTNELACHVSGSFVGADKLVNILEAVRQVVIASGV
jgi:hypothetical protein